jgi:hypothetical protein
MAEQGHEGSGFKVVDRRPFAVDGTRREDAPREEEQASPKAEKPRSSAEKATSAQDERLDEGFLMLVEFLAHTALAHLGLVGTPGGEPLPVDLESARAMTDLLGVLQDKTRGNLSTAEQKVIGDVLFELHTRFVEIQKRASAKRK